MSEDRRLVDHEVRAALVEARNTPAVVVAGAGSGKTTILVDRVAGELTTPGGLEPSHLAAITFTERAARELIHRLAEAAPEIDLDEAYIGTIHGFCQRILRRFPFEAGLPPVFELVDEATALTRAEERAQRQINQLYQRAEDHPDLMEALRLIASDGRLGDLVALAMGIDRVWADYETVELAAPLTNAELGQRIEERTAELGRLLAHPWVASGADRLAEKLISIVPAWLAEVAANPFTANLNIGFKPRNAGSENSWLNEVGISKADARELAQAAMGGGKASPGQPSVADLIRAEALSRVLHHLVPVAVADARRRVVQGEVTFDDLLVLTRRLLAQHPSVLAEVRAWFRQIYVDEFQDTDDLQHEIVMALCTPDPDLDRLQSPSTLFVVGDPKQAIYSFRHARPEILVEMAQDTTLTHELVTNFRSRPAVCDWINRAIAPRFAEPRAPQADYADLVPARHDRSDTTPAVTVIGVTPEGTPVEHATARSVAEAEAADLAGLISSIVAEGSSWTVGGGRSPLRAARRGDIAILIRNRSRLSVLESALRSAGIAYRIEGGSLLYDSREVYELLRVMRAIHTPEVAHRVVTALRTSVLGVSDRELVAFRRVFHYWALPSAHRLDAARAEGVVTDEVEAVLDALAALRSWSQRSLVVTPAQLMSEIYEATFGAVASALADGVGSDESWRRVRATIDEARAWSDRTAGTLGEYLDWVANRVASTERFDLSTDEKIDAVRIMTIHAAKGLQFPIVMVAGLGGGDATDAHVQVGVAEGRPRVRLTKRYQVGEPEDPQAIRLAEEARLAYVAFTRAEDALVVSLHQPKKGTTAATRLSKVIPVEAVTAPAVSVVEGADTGPCPPVMASVAIEALDPVDDYESLDIPLIAHRRDRWVWTPSAIADSLGTLDHDHSSVQSSEHSGYGMAIGSAVHAVLEDVPFDDPTDGLAQRAAAAAAHNDVSDIDTVETLARSIISSARFGALAAAKGRRELYVSTSFGEDTDKVISLWGYVDALYRRDDGSVVIIDFKTDGVADDVASLATRYRYQLSAYAVAVERSTGLRVSEAVLLVSRSDGSPAVDVPIDLLGAEELIDELARASTSLVG